MGRTTKEYMYLDKLNIKYFEEQIEEDIKYCIDEFGEEDALENLNRLYIQVAGLRDIFFIFSIDDVIKLLQPIKDTINKIKK